MYLLLFLCMKLIAIHAILPPNARIGWKTAMEYLRDSQAIVIYNAADYYIDDLFSQNDHRVLPSVVYTRNIADVRKALFPNMTKEMMKEIPAEPIGYVCLVNDGEGARVIIKDLGEHWPRAKIVIYTEKVITNLENLLKLAWSNYDMMNVVVIQSANRLITLSVNNPFEKVDDDAWGYVHTFVANDENASAVLTTAEMMMNRRLMDMQYYPVKMSIRATTILRSKSKDGTVIQVDPVEEIIQYLIADRMRYRFIRIESNVQHPTAIFNNMINERSIMFVNPLFMWEYGDGRRFAFTKPFWMEQWCFIAPKFQPSSPVIPLGPPLDTPTKMASLVTLLLCALVWYLMRIYYNATSSPSFWKTLIDSVSLAVSAPVDAPLNTSERLLFLMLSYYSLLLVNIYQGLIVTQVTTAKDDTYINTLQQLEESGLSIAVLSFSKNRFLMEIEESSSESPFKKLMEKAYVSQTLGISENRTIPLMSAALYPRNGIEIAVNDRYWTENGSDMFQLVDECAYTYYDAALVPVTSPYIDRFDEILLLLHSNGIFSYWIERKSEQIKMLRFRRIYQYDESDLKKFSLICYWIVFVMYGTGITVSILVFIAEILYKKLMD